MGVLTQSPQPADQPSRNMPGRDQIKQIYNSAVGIVSVGQSGERAPPLQPVSNYGNNYGGMNHRPPLPANAPVIRSHDNLSRSPPGAVTRNTRPLLFSGYDQIPMYQSTQTKLTTLMQLYGNQPGSTKATKKYSLNFEQGKASGSPQTAEMGNPQHLLLTPSAHRAGIENSNLKAIPPMGVLRVRENQISPLRR
jgi:hypothetical protein